MKLLFSFFLLLILMIFNLGEKDPIHAVGACDRENLTDSDKSCFGTTTFYQDY